MSDHRFSSTVRRAGDSVVMDLTGDINAFAAEQLETATAEALAGSPQRLVLNFDATNFINSTGIALIVEILGASRAARVPVVAFGLTDHYREIFEITRLIDYMDIVADEGAALSLSTVIGMEQGGHRDA